MTRYRRGALSRLARLLGSLGRAARPLSRGLVRALPLCLVLGGFLVGLAALWHTACRAQAFEVKDTGPPLFTDADLPLEGRAELGYLQHAAVGVHLLRPGALASVRGAYEASPWVARIDRLERDIARGSVRAELTVRLPAAQLVHEGFAYPIDAHGVLLSDIRMGQLDPQLPVIRCSLSSLPAPGEVCPGRELAQALGVLRAVDRSVLSDMLNVREVRVQTYAFYDVELRRRTTQPSVDLYTDQGARIRWGPFNAGDDPSELRTSEKIARLRRILGRGVPLDDGSVIDVRTRSVYYSRGPDRDGR